MLLWCVCVCWLQQPTDPACSPLLSWLQRLLDYIKPDFVHIMQAGSIVRTGDMGLVDQLEADGYAFLDEGLGVPVRYSARD